MHIQAHRHGQVGVDEAVVVCRHIGGGPAGLPTIPLVVACRQHRLQGCNRVEAAILHGMRRVGCPAAGSNLWMVVLTVIRMQFPIQGMQPHSACASRCTNPTFTFVVGVVDPLPLAQLWRL